MKNKQLKDLCEQAGMECSLGHWYIEDKHLERFAELVRQDERDAVIDIVARHGGSVEIEAAVRQRGEK